MKKIAVLFLVIGAFGVVNHIWKRLQKTAINTEASQVAAGQPGRPVSPLRGSLSAGQYHVLALNTNGELFGWGSNANMELGLISQPSKQDRDIPTVFAPVKLPSQQRWRYIFAGTQSSYGISEDGQGWWHWHPNMAIAPSRHFKEDNLAEYYSLGTDIQWRIIKGSGSISAGIDSTGSLRVWDSSRLSPSKLQPGLVFQPVKYLIASPQNEWQDFCNLGNTFYAVAKDGSLWKHGGRIIFSVAQLDSNSDSIAGEFVFTQLNAPARFHKVVCRENASHVLMLDYDNKLWGFGGNDFGELGNGDGDRFTSNTPVPEGQLTQLTDKRWIDIAVGHSLTFGIAADGSLWGWGNNSDGALGTGNHEYRDIPTLIDNRRVWVAVAASLQSGVALTSGGEIFTWGKNEYGLLGDGGVSDTRLLPTQVVGTQKWGVDPNLPTTETPESLIERILTQEIERSGIGCSRELFELPFSSRQSRANGSMLGCDHCEVLARLGLVSKSVVEYIDEQLGQTAYDIRYNLTDLGKITYVPSSASTINTQVGKFCFGRARLFRIEEIKSPIIFNGETIYGVTYTIELAAPQSPVFDAEVEQLGIDSPQPGSPALYPPHEASVILLPSGGGYVDDSLTYEK